VGETQSPEFRCPTCGKRHKWNPALAGRRARCSCGEALTIPNHPPDQDEYDIAPDLTPTPIRPAIAASSAPSVPLGYRAPKDDKPATADTDRLKNFIWPISLLGGGLTIELIEALWRWHNWLFAVGINPALLIAFELAADNILMLVGIFIAARLRHFALGPFGPAILKLAAISVAPSAVIALFTPILMFIPFGGLLGLIGEFILYFALIGLLFDLEESDTWFCVWTIFITRIAVYLLLWGLVK
jgi:hypothetical protein